MGKNRYLTIWLALICIIMFILQLIFPGLTDSLILNNSALSGEIWRFITAIFIHANFTHLLFNLFALVLFGLLLESMIGSKKLVLIFLSTGIFANLIAVFFYNSSLGASGAIFGIIGVLTIIRPLMPVFIYSLPMPMFIAAIIWTLAAIFGVFNPTGTGDIAHLSGLALGFIIGLFLRKKHKVKQRLRAEYSRINIPEHEMRSWEDRWMK